MRFLLLFSILCNTSLLSLEELTDATPDYISKTYNNALEYFKKGKYDDALVQIRHVIRADMRNYNLRMLAAHCYLRQKKYEPAFAHFQVAEKSNRNAPGVYIDQALALHGLQENKKALQKLRSLERRVQADKLSPKFFNLKARILFHLGDFNQALTTAERAKAAYSTSGKGIKDQLESILIESRIHLAREEFEKAEILADWALSIKSDNPYALNLMGNIYDSWFRSDQEASNSATLRNKALETYEQALSIAKGNKALTKIIQRNKESLESL